jgi:hypothetical protein
MHAVLKHWHPMVGVDLHIPVVPPPGPPAPYYTFHTLAGTYITSKIAWTHASQGVGFTMQEGTDIGPFILHSGPPSVTLPVEWVLSSSKSHFSSSAYMADGERVAVALMMIVNPNLNCGTPVPTPFGFVLAFNTHMVHMSLADYMAGYISLFVDFGLQSLLQWGTGRALGAISSRLGPKFLSKTAAKRAVLTANRNRAHGTPKLNVNQGARMLMERRSQLVEAFGRHGPRVASGLAWLAGGPLGLGPESITGWSPGGAASNAANRAVRSYFNQPSVEEHSGGADADRDTQPADDGN